MDPRTPPHQPAPRGIRLIQPPAHPGRRRRRRPRPPRLRRRWLPLLLPLLGIGALIAIAPPLPPHRAGPAPEAQGGKARRRDAAGPFAFRRDALAYRLELDPRQVGFDLFEGWDREQEAYADGSALAFVSGPMYERHGGGDGREVTVPLGDLKFGERVIHSRNRTAARQRAYLGIRHDGRIDFGYGELTPQRQATYETFIGGLHSIYNDLEAPPPTYRGAYSISMGQQIRYVLPRIRIVYGLRPDGRLEILMSRDGLTLEQTRALARERGLQAAYLPDHASKSRLIVPGRKGFSTEDANWISGGATSFVHVPYLLRLRRRALPLQGTLLAVLPSRLPQASCGQPLACGRSLGSQLVDRTLAGFNRLMEQGVEPVARLLWGPKGGRPADRDGLRAPLREPVITADPRPVRLRQEKDLGPGLARLLERQPAPPAAPAASEEAGLPAARSPIEAGGAPPQDPASAAVQDPGAPGAASDSESSPAAMAPPPLIAPPPLSPPPPPPVALPPPVAPPPPLP